MIVSGCAGFLRTEPEAWQKNTADDDTASIMSFNILVGGWPTDRVLAAISDASPDLLCLQELTPGFADAFSHKFADDYPYRYFLPAEMAGGIGIASRYPLSNRKILPLGIPFMPALVADAEFQWSTAHIACLHLVPPLAQFGEPASSAQLYQRNNEIRLKQVSLLLEHLNNIATPVLVLGDINEWQGQSALAALADAGFEDACLQPHSRCGPTWPAAVIYWPAAVQIDHILGRGIEFRQTAVLEADGSDHYPVATRFRPAVH